MPAGYYSGLSARSLRGWFIVDDILPSATTSDSIRDTRRLTDWRPFLTTGYTGQIEEPPPKKNKGITKFWKQHNL